MLIEKEQGIQKWVQEARCRAEGLDKLIKYWELEVSRGKFPVFKVYHVNSRSSIGAWLVDILSNYLVFHLAQMQKRVKQEMSYGLLSGSREIFSFEQRYHWLEIENHWSEPHKSFKKQSSSLFTVLLNNFRDFWLIHVGHSHDWFIFIFWVFVRFVDLLKILRSCLDVTFKNLH